MKITPRQQHHRLGLWLFLLFRQPLRSLTFVVQKNLLVKENTRSRISYVRQSTTLPDDGTAVLPSYPAHEEVSLSKVEVDKRPHEQRVKAPRPARRLNHGFKFLYRHDVPERIQDMDPITYLQDFAGYSMEQVLQMNQSFPPLLTLSVPRQLHPKLRFLKETLNASSTLSVLPPKYFGARLERILAPRHAFLVYNNLPHGSELIHDASRWNMFLKAARKPKHFAALCHSWQRESETGHGRNADATIQKTINVKMIEAFDALFGRGLMAAARNELVQHNNTWPLQHINITAAEIMDLLLQHGANGRKLDHRGVSLLHWAAGTGHIEAIDVLLRYEQKQRSRENQRNDQLDVFDTRTLRDGASALHWAAAGAKAREFGCGGHVETCRHLLGLVSSTKRKSYVNLLTKDGNSALMWAAWSGTLETVKLLVRHRAEAEHKNRNGCTVAHWAASGGNVEVCQYLHETVGVDFATPNYGGNTPLTHAVAFGRREVVEWLRASVLRGNAENEKTAYNLARDFVHWTDGDDRRKQVLKMFEDWYSFDESDSDIAQDADDEDLLYDLF